MFGSLCKDQYGSYVSCNLPSVSTICRGYHYEPSGLSAFIFIIHLREPSVIVRRQILCRNSSDVMLGTIQYFRVTAVSGCLADVLRADVNPLFMSIPWERIYFYLRLKSGSANAERQLSCSQRVNQQLQGHPRIRTQGSAVSPFRAPVGPNPIQIWCSCFDVYEPTALKIQDNG